MTIVKAMKAKALAEFDAIAAAQEADIRARLAALGRSRAEIDREIALCEAGLAEQRAEIGRLVTVELMKAGVPLETPANVWN